MTAVKKLGLCRVPPEIINRMNDIQEAVDKIHRKVAYIGKTIRTYEEEEGHL
jgi:hypothetical protein